METLKELLSVLVPLSIIMDPLGNLPFFIIFTRENTRRERVSMAAIASSAACAVLIFFALTGDAILDFFDIGIPAFQIAGGFIFFVYSLQLLHLIPMGIKSTKEEEEEGIAKENAALVPLAIPLLAGPGAITAVVVWRNGTEDSVGILPLLIAIIIACLSVFVVFYFGEKIHHVLGVGGIRVVTRLMGLLLAVIAVEFIVKGVEELCL